MDMIEHLFKDSGLDRIDIKMLSLLRTNARAPLSELAKKCRISKQTAHYRLTKLVRDKVAIGFHTIIDYTKLGYDIYYVFVQTRYIENEQEFIGELSKISGCLIITKSITQYGYTMKVITKDAERMMLELEALFTKAKSITSHFILQRLGKSKEQDEIDDKDRAILEMMHIDCRQSALEIAQKTGLGYDVVNGRIKKLIARKIITGFLTLVNFDREGFLDYSIVLKFADDKLELAPLFSETLGIDPLVIEKYKTLGEFSYMFELVDNNYVEINNKINLIRSKFYNLIRYSQIVPIQNHYFFKVSLGDPLTR